MPFKENAKETMTSQISTEEFFYFFLFLFQAISGPKGRGRESIEQINQLGYSMFE